MERIRIGNDIELRWKIYTTDAEGVSSPYDLTGKTLEVSLFNAFAEGEVPLDFTTQENEITAIYRGKDQKVTGRYSIILRENNGADGMKTVDEHDAFELVCRTMDESRNDDGDVKCYHLSFQSTLSLGGGSIDLSAYAKKEDVDAALEGKQDTISDLDAIRQGAAKGSTALQSESDPVYLADKPKIALKVEIPDVSGKVDKVVGKGLSSNDYTDADKLKLAGLENYDDTQVRELIAGKANLQHKHTVADITDFPELYYDATAFLTSGAYPSDRYEELLEAVKAKRTVYATIDEGGYVSYVFFMSSANSEVSSSRVLLTTIFADGGNLYINTFVLQQSGMTRLQESITGKADKATTLAGYGIADAYTKSEVDAALDGKQDKITIFTETAGLSSYSINPNMLTKLGTLASNVTLSLNTASEEAGVVNIYDIIFTTPAEAPSITWPEGISWVGGAAPIVIAGGVTYEVSIMYNLATYGEY